MPCFIKSSLIYRLISSLAKRIKAYYSSSHFKLIVEKIVNCFKQSRTTSIIVGYIKKNPYFLNSYFYKLMRAIAGLIDKLLGGINRLFAPLLGGSLVVKDLKAIDSFPILEKLRLLAVLIASIEFGYCLGSFVKGTLAQVSSVYIIAPVILCFILLCLKSIIPTFKNSLIYKGIKFFFD